MNESVDSNVPGLTRTFQLSMQERAFAVTSFRFWELVNLDFEALYRKRHALHPQTHWIFLCWKSVSSIRHTVPTVPYHVLHVM